MTNTQRETPKPYVLIFNKGEWLMNPIFQWTEEEIDAADSRGFIGTKNGVDCYLARRIEAMSLPNT